MLLACLTVEATITMRDLIERVAGEADSMYVVIRRVEGSDTYWYAWTVEDLRFNANQWPPERVDANLTSALQLHEYQADTTYDSSTGGDLSSAHGVLLRGSQAVGVLRPESGTRGGGGGVMRGGGPGDAPRAPGGAAAARDASRKPFSAYPNLKAPEHVASRETFDLGIGLSAKPVAGVAGGPITGTVPPDFDFDLQIVADGFEMPDGSKATLHVVRDQFEDASTSLRLVAPEVGDGSTLRSDLEVLFFFEGNLCGRAIKTILVGGDGVAAAPEVIEGSATVSIPDAPAPDLTVMISRGSDETRLQWTFVTPHDVPDVPAEPVAHTLKNDSAKSFALDLVRNLSEWDRNALAPAQLLGIGEQISGAMPNEFWLTLDKIWAKKQTNGGEAPSVLMVSEDPYVPWELAATTQNYARPERLDNTKPPFLGAQLRIGRWIPPDPTPFGGDVPALPPRITAEVDKMVLFVGDYDALVSGQRPLPQAIEEGKKLALRYSGIQREAVLNDVTDLVRDEIVEGGQPVKVDAIHFACHGEVSQNPRHNGIVLSDRAVRLSADMIFGSEIGTTSNPFVFINACQLGIATEQLDGDYGGLAGAFLDKGATGFVSPLWSVDDDIAQEFALDFYKEVYDQDTPAPVAEVMRELRSRFDMDSTSPAASYLAYVYYGHPDLIIDKL